MYYELNISYIYDNIPVVKSFNSVFLYTDIGLFLFADFRLYRETQSFYYRIEGILLFWAYPQIRVRSSS